MPLRIDIVMVGHVHVFGYHGGSKGRPVMQEPWSFGSQ